MLCVVVVEIDIFVIIVVIVIITNKIVGYTLVEESKVGTSVIGYVGKVFDHADGVTQTLKTIVFVICVTMDIW